MSTAVRALREKYREILRLRAEQERGNDIDPRGEMAALAGRFPGALRELDELPLPVIEARVQALEQVLAGEIETPGWVRLQVSYHGWMRAVLRIKRFASERRDADAARLRTELATRYAPASDEPSLEKLDLAAIGAILEPEAGRLNPWVFAQVAAEHGVTPEEVRAALFLRGLARRAPEGDRD